MSNNGSIVIGVLGGMGTYATIDLFEKYARIFPAEKEWDRPRIIIDNNCTMPSRVRAILYNENVDILVKQMADSIKNLILCGSTHIILACNTSHLFLPQIYDIVPEAKDRIVSIIDATVENIVVNGIKDIHLLASEGTIETQVYQRKLSEHGIHCTCPNDNQYNRLRECIEAVKQNKYTEHIQSEFIDLINNNESIILGCTELPMLYELYKDFINGCVVYDPIQIVLNRIKKETEGIT